VDLPPSSRTTLIVMSEESFSRVTWFILMCEGTDFDVWHDSFWRVTCFVLTCYVTRLYVWHDWSRWVPCDYGVVCGFQSLLMIFVVWRDSFWRVRTTICCNLSRDPFWRVTWFILMSALQLICITFFFLMSWLAVKGWRDMTCCNVWRDSLGDVTWLFAMSDVTRFDVRHDSL